MASMPFNMTLETPKLDKNTIPYPSMSLLIKEIVKDYNKKTNKLWVFVVLNA